MLTMGVCEPASRALWPHEFQYLQRHNFVSSDESKFGSNGGTVKNDQSRPTVKNEQWSIDRFLRVRNDEVLTQADTDLKDVESGVEAHLKLKPHQHADVTMRVGREMGITVVQPRHGDTLIAIQIAAMQSLEEAGADILSTVTDPYTRQLEFANAAKALEESERVGRSMVSGYPVVAMGVERTKEIVASVSKPCSVRMASKDSRLAKEIYLAAGYTYMFMGPVQNLAYEKWATPEALIQNYQYDDRLIAYYGELGAPVVKEFPATLTGTLVPPCIAVASSLLDAMLAVTQGVKHIVVNYGMLGNLVQDVAAMRVLRTLANEKLTQLGDDLEIYLAVPQWMGDFPHDDPQAYAVILNGAFNAAMGEADEVITKSLDEAFGVPSKQSNAAGVRTTRQMLGLLKGQRLEDSPELEEEIDDIRLSVNAILDAVVRLGEGDVAVGTAAAIRGGIIDVPFSPNLCNASRAMPIRDLNGAVRWLDPGDVPVPDSVRLRHKHLVGRRLKTRPEKSPLNLVTEDITGFSKGLSVDRSTPREHAAR